MIGRYQNAHAGGQTQVVEVKSIQEHRFIMCMTVTNQRSFRVVFTLKFLYFSRQNII